MSQIKGYAQRVGNFSTNAKSFLGCIGLNFVSLGAVQVLLGLYILELGFAEDFFGLVVGARILTTGLLAVPAGTLNEKIGAKNSLFLASILAGIAIIIQALSSSKFLILTGSLMYGGALAILFVMIGPFLSNNSQAKEREELFSFNFVLMTAAKTIGSFLVGFLPIIFVKTILAQETTELLSHRYVLLAFGIIALLAVIPTIFIDEDEDDKEKQDEIDVVDGLKEERISKLSLYQFLLGAGGGLIAPFFSVFLANKLGATTQEVGTMMFLYRVTMALALFLTPYLVGKMGKVKSVGVAQITSLPFLLAIVLVPNFAIVSFAFLFRGALMNITKPIASDFAMEITSDAKQTTTSSLMRTSKSVARSVAAMLAGWLVANYGYKATYFLTFFFYLTGAFLFVKSFLSVEKKELKGIKQG
ncbi:MULTISPECIES: MFS transporter [unclassified Candidatus Frackibacter]|uniref:MFS transporter n=1 Tax=unclassified Candidatus Frackibacter TaxID=2648818 RepID=UPI00088824B5|nr:MULTISPECIES: MFS transporter [unclassified Candidatus Frackibacter]SDC34364.1 Na+/melibiose symporter [Candidatus Frackibacter sp. WG11]SEM56898.1 Na+/melibiose symporter [Candidatus Frackibacter sp. WG12]SFL70378.1 Na+/melibiose symporter [Candidatus Frackibacter sp. WG13]